MWVGKIGLIQRVGRLTVGKDKWRWNANGISERAGIRGLSVIREKGEGFRGLGGIGDEGN